MRRLVLLFFSAIILLASPAAAKDGQKDYWIVSQLSGEARVVKGGLHPASLKINSALAPGDVIVTGPTGRATLARNADYILIAPRSELRLPSTQQPTGFTRIIQSLGTMLFRVQHTGVPHFAVDTPMLAAVVKGTTFTIVVDRNRSAVQVTQGVVEVSANDGGMKQLVTGGNTVFINRSDPKTIIDADAQPAKASTTTTAAVTISGSQVVPLAAIASLTTGLVRADAAPEPAPKQASTVAIVLSAAAEPAPGTTSSVPTTTDGTDPIAKIVATTDPLVETVDTTISEVTDAVLDVVDTTVTAVTEPVLDVIDTTVPSATEPVLEVIDTTVPTVTEPVVDVIDTTIPSVTEPVVEVIDTTVPTVIEPVVDVVAPPASVVVAPVVELVPTVPPPPPPVIPLPGI
jgi:hypothetical protein